MYAHKMYAILLLGIYRFKGRRKFMNLWRIKVMKVMVEVKQVVVLGKTLLKT